MDGGSNGSESAMPQEVASSSIKPEMPELRKEFNRLYRDFFDRSERKRRWNLREDIPWGQANPKMDPAIADVVEAFCAVELFLPDYIGKALPLIRANKGWAWFHANWGYEESKHSYALGDWLLLSGMRTEEQMTDFEDRVFQHEWNLPHESPQGMVIYGMVQEMATWLNYRNLRARVDEHGDPALSEVLRLISIDERAHHSFYRRVVELFLKMDRAGTIEQMGRVFGSFAMPALHMLAESQQRTTQIRELGIFDEVIFMKEIYFPLLEDLGVSRREMRQPAARK